LLLATVVYYLGTMAIGHSEIRYGLPMQAVLIVFAGVAVARIPAWSKLAWQRLKPGSQRELNS
jgi:hypothetical protein